MIPQSISLAPAARVSAPPARPPANLVEAARQFEALMIGQLLKESHAGEAGWPGDGEESGNATMTEVAEEHFAQALAKSGGLGLGATLIKSLTPPER